MMNNLLNVIVLGSLVGTFVVFAPAPDPRPMATRPSPSNVAAAPPVVAVSATVSSQQPPIPLVRSQRTLPAVATSPEARTYEAAREPQDDFDKTAAKAAIEADGYKGVTVLSKGADGIWRAKGYRGRTEVQLTVDSAGRVSTQ